MTETRRVVARRPHSEDTTYDEPDGDIPNAGQYIDRYVDGRYVNNGQTVIEATVDDGSVQEIEVWGNCASADAHNDADDVSGNTLKIHP